MVTVSELRAERKRALRQVRASLNKFQKSFNKLHRELDKRLEGHRKELLDLKDAQKIVEESTIADELWQVYKLAVIPNLSLFFR